MAGTSQDGNETFQCTICKKRMNSKRTKEIKIHPKLEVIVCKVSEDVNLYLLLYVDEF